MPDIILLTLVVLSIGCKSYSKHPIDEKPLVKIDNRILGLWKAVEDTDKANYIIIQNYSDVQEIDTHRPDIEAKNKHCFLYMTYMNWSGENPRYQQFSVFPSKIKGETFLNVMYTYTPMVNGAYVVEREEDGYFFVKLIRVTTDTIVTAIVADTTLKQLPNSKEVRNRLEKNSSKRGFYSDTMHFYKVSAYHNLKGSQPYANPPKKK